MGVAKKGEIRVEFNPSVWFVDSRLENDGAFLAPQGMSTIVPSCPLGASAKSFIRCEDYRFWKRRLLQCIRGKLEWKIDQEKRDR